MARCSGERRARHPAKWQEHRGDPMATATAATPTISARAWVVLALGVAAQTAGTVFVSAPAFLIPLLHTERGLSLAQAGLLAAIPTFGMVLTLILWGALADRIGEKWVITGGLILTALAAGGAILADGYLALGVFLLLGGMASASTNSASGRIVVGWFPKHKRGLAMGIRQMSQPLGVTVAAVTIPVIAADAGVGAALFVPFALTAVLAVACAIGLANPPRPAPRAGTPSVRAGNPYRSSGFLWRIHAASVLLVVPQFTISTFGLVWLVSDQGWDALAAGVLVGAAQFVGAIGRIVIGVVSDRVGSRVRPLRWVAVSVASVLLVLAAVDAAHWGAAAVVFVLATTCTVAPNGLAFTSVAEMAGPGWSGKALGVQNTGQFVAASLVGPLMGALIGVVGYPLTFAVAAVFPALAVPVVPRAHAEHDHL
ncbi:MULTISPECIES: MFS transporter [Cryobacterium]|uniref:MFS transporter n=2 Tax=Microbacteriaceae TaxID=85023 RepID=UPI00311AB743